MFDIFNINQHYIIVYTSLFYFFYFVQNDPKVYTNFSGFPEKSEALDNNLHTFYQSDAQRDMLWFLRLNSAYEIKWILVSIRGGLDLNSFLSKLSSAYNMLNKVTYVELI